MFKTEAAGGRFVPPATTGPRYVYHDDASYMRRLDAEDVDTWYGTICKAASPRAFSRQDHESGPSAGDLVVTKSNIHHFAGRAYRDMSRGHIPDQAELYALEVVVHEHTHCLVRLSNFGVPLAQDLRCYSHPDTPGRAVLHAFGRDCRLGVNAFTGVLRRRPSPRRLRDGMLGHGELPEAWWKGLAWFAQHVDDKPTPYAT